MNASEADLVSVPDIGPITATYIAAFFNEAHNCRLIAELAELGVQWGEEIPSTSAATLEGRTYVLTGSFSALSRNELKAKLQSLGAKVSGSISAKSTALIAGEGGGGKRAKAETLNVPVLSETEGLALIEPLL